MSEPVRTPMQWCGPWDADADYLKGDCVYYAGSLFVAEVDELTGLEPGTYSMGWFKIS